MRFPSERAYSRQVVEMCQAFFGLGHDVCLAVNSRKTHVGDVPEKYYGLKFGYKLIRFRTPDLAEFGKMGFAVSTLVFCLDCVWHILNNKYDLIYCRNEWVLAALEIFFPRRKKIYESHEAKFSWPVRLLFGRGVKCVAISEGIEDFYLKKGINQTQILVAHDAINESFFTEPEPKNSVRERLGLPNNIKIAMYIGGFDAWKGVETFTQAGELATDIKFVAIGGNPKKVIDLKNKFPNVIFLGELPYKDLKDNQQAADVLVIPNTAKNTLSSQYTSPLKLFAHLASRVPIVVSDIPSLRNVVSDNEVYFVASDNPVKLLETVKEVMVVNDRNNKIEKAYVLAKKFTWPERAKKILNFVK